MNQLSKPHHNGQEALLLAIDAMLVPLAQVHPMVSHTWKRPQGTLVPAIETLTEQGRQVKRPWTSVFFTWSHPLHASPVTPPPRSST